MRALVTLTSEESKRLIAKAVARMDSVQKAAKEGLIGFALCTSSGFVIQELLGKEAVDPGGYCSGFIYSHGSCGVPPERREKLLLLEKGQPRRLDFPAEDLTLFLDRMGEDDIIVKSGNMMDPQGRVGVLLASPDGGEAGRYLPHVLAKGIRLIVPMTLNKTVPTPLDEIMAEMGITRFRRSRVHGLCCGMMPLPGMVVTEIDACRELYGVRALPAAMNGIGSGAGAVTLVLTGGEEEVERAWREINLIKGEPPLVNYFSDCGACEDARGAPGGPRCSTRARWKNSPG
ncbi:MAG: hypothetical protein AB1896_01440 [Thermodesulfobacteriota bacterium]